jgi:Methyltransferase domain
LSDASDAPDGWFRTNEGELLPDFMFYDPEVPHLGGYLKGGDPGSFYPDLWKWALERFHVHSVIDVGCGEGHSLNWFREHGCEVLGVEGIEQPDPDIVQHDYTTGPFRPRRRFDLAWSCEFVEHVAWEHIPNFVATFRSANVLMMTHATGTGGHHHVNAQQSDYWIEVLDRAGFIYDEVLTQRARMFTPNGYFKDTGLVFRRRR